jgi:peptidoglycan/xylan/chitin deacetylase (PgdA/CDA1 family)
MQNNKNNIKQIVKKGLGFLYYYAYKKYLINLGNKCLIYHAFGSKLKHDTYGISISMANFKKHIDYLRDNYQFKKVHDIADDRLYISISIDDGYKCTIGAIDLLNRYNIPVSLFITAGILGKDQYLTVNDLKEISKLSNVTIGSHGFSHQKLSTMAYSEQNIELQNSKDFLSEITGREITGLSFPHGSFNRDTINILAKLKYEYAATSIKGVNTISTDRYSLCRNEIISTDSIADVDKKIKGYYEYY